MRSDSGKVLRWHWTQLNSTVNEFVATAATTETSEGEEDQRQEDEQRRRQPATSGGGGAQFNLIYPSAEIQLVQLDSSGQHWQSRTNRAEQSRGPGHGINHMGVSLNWIWKSLSLADSQEDEEGEEDERNCPGICPTSEWQRTITINIIVDGHGL